MFDEHKEALQSVLGSEYIVQLIDADHLRGTCTKNGVSRFFACAFSDTKNPHSVAAEVGKSIRGYFDAMHVEVGRK